jgi:hypothetical protein
MRRPWKLLAAAPVLMGAAVMFHPIVASASPVPTSWCTPIYFETGDSQSPDTAWGDTVGECQGPIKEITAENGLDADDWYSQVASGYDDEDNSNYAIASATDDCDFDPSGCYGDNPFGLWSGVVFYTLRGWYDDNGSGCTIDGDYLLCSANSNEWNWPS